MIDIKSNIDHLEERADEALDTETGKDIRAAAADLKNLRDYAVQLERNIERMSADLQTLKDSANSARYEQVAECSPGELLLQTMYSPSCKKARIEAYNENGELILEWIKEFSSKNNGAAFSRFIKTVDNYAYKNGIELSSIEVNLIR
jgi:predicted ribosome quality control (RQC) complex YloA/Tae2 family protein